MKDYSSNHYRFTPLTIDDGSEQSFTLYSRNFSAKPSNRSHKPTQYLIVGFDTEYVRRTFEESYEDTVETRDKHNQILSYQYSCKIVDEDETRDVNNIRWNGIVLPKSGEVKDRLELVEFIHIALGDGIKKYPDIQIPYDIFLIAHFTRADIPAFAEFHKDIESRQNLNFDNLRKSFVNLTSDIPLKYLTADNEQVDRKLKVRDSIHLAPSGKQKLDDLGEMLGFPKLKVGKDSATDRYYKENMDKLLEDDWQLFRDYAITDADICVAWIEKIIRINQQHQSRFTLPATLTSIGVQLLEKYWEDRGVNPLRMVGKERTRDRIYNERTNKTEYKFRTPYISLLDNVSNFLNSCYHGGRNEQFWFGVSPRGKWYDYDLTSAYPSAMCLIGIPDWDSLKPIFNLEELLYQGKYTKTGKPRYRYPTDLVFGEIEFEFPESVRYPCLPVRQETGVLFPRKGRCHTHISEILLAHRLGAKIEFKFGIEIPSKRHKLESGEFHPFKDFTKHCVNERKKHEKGSLQNLFWKELVNSTYGKTAQGLQVRRIYELKNREMTELEPSLLTNPVFASFITAFCRATLSEVMNNLPKEVLVFSVTTDGFLTNATPQQLEDSAQGNLCKYYRSSRQIISETDEIFEVKHISQQLVGWRTRGQSTLLPSTPQDWQGIDGDGSKEDNRFVLAKGGIKLPTKERLTKSQETEDINRMFFNRQPEDTYTVKILENVKDMFEDGTDLVDKEIIKRLSMEFDWKRKPNFIGECQVEVKESETDKHLFFSTTAWEDVTDFHQTKWIWEDYNSVSRKNLKTLQDYADFCEYHAAKMATFNTENDGMVGKYLKREDGIENRIRQQIAIAQSKSAVGTIKINEELDKARGKKCGKKVTKKELAKWLQVILGIEVTPGNLYNDVKKIKTDEERRNTKEFIPHLIPNTPSAVNYLTDIKQTIFPELDIPLLLSRQGRFTIDGCDIKDFKESHLFSGRDEETGVFR